MTRLEDLQPSAAVRGILPDGLVTVVSVAWFGSEALELTYKTPEGKVANELLYRHDEPRIEVVELGRPWSFFKLKFGYAGFWVAYKTTFLAQEKVILNATGSTAWLCCSKPVGARHPQTPPRSCWRMRASRT